MRISIEAREYSQTAILAAIKKQQVFADWRIEDRDDSSILVSYGKACLPDEECAMRLRRQLDDEVVRERLEADFGSVRDMLVSAALAPIIRNKDAR